MYGYIKPNAEIEITKEIVLTGSPKSIQISFKYGNDERIKSS